MRRRRRREVLKCCMLHMRQRVSCVQCNMVGQRFEHRLNACSSNASASAAREEPRYGDKLPHVTAWMLSALWQELE